jgi:tetratricopeptide (TPR) repeat protein
MELTTRKKWWFGIGAWGVTMYGWLTNPSEEKSNRIAKWFVARAVDVRFNGEKIDLRDKPDDGYYVQSGLAAFHQNMLFIKSIDFHGLFSKSKSNKWIIGWNDSDETHSRGGHRKSGHGRFVLYDAETDLIVTQGDKLERPNNGAIADNGTFSLEDCHFGNDLSGTLYVFSRNGDVLFERKFTANIHKSGMSINGLYAACATACSSTDDGSKLYFFDIANKKEIFCINLTLSVSTFEFVEEKCHLIVNNRGLGKVRYSADGDFIDNSEDQDANLNSDKYGVIISTADEILKLPDISTERIRVVLEAIIKARALGADNNEAWRATALKVQGLAHAAIGENKEAVDAFEEALRLDPRIGIKGKMNLLKRKLNS